MHASPNHSGTELTLGGNVSITGNTLTGGNAGGSEIASSEAVAQMLDSMPLRGIVNFGGPAAAGMITPLLEILRAAIQ